MAGEWKEVPLDKVYDFSSGLSKPRSEFGVGHPFLSFKDVFYNTFVPNKLTELVNSTEQERRACSIKRGDVFLTRTSETMDELGMSCVALKNHKDATFNGFTKRLRPKPNTSIVPEYSGYFFRSPKFRQAVTAMSSMSTRASLNNEMLARLTIDTPPVDVQKAIGNILKSFDDKIELNRRMNETLEAMARTLFKSWFIDFDPVRRNAARPRNQPSPAASRHPLPVGEGQGVVAGEFPSPSGRRTGDEGSFGGEAFDRLFPDSFEDSELGEIPKGWEVVNLNDVADINYGQNLPQTELLGSGIPVFGGAGVIGYYSEAMFKDPIVLVTSRGSGSGTVHETHGPSFVTNNSFSVIPKAGWFSRHYLKASLLNGDISSLVTGSAQPQLTITNFSYLKLIQPPESVAREFHSFADSLWQKKNANQNESHTLAALRNTLLPKLISGELRVSSKLARVCP